MSEFLKIALTAGFTIVGGVLVYVIGQAASKFFIEPIQELKKAIGEVRFNLSFYAKVILTDAARTPERSAKVSEALMKNSSDLFARANTIPCYDCLQRRLSHFLPPKTSVLKAAMWLRGLSNSVYATEPSDLQTQSKNYEIIQKIESLLGLDPLE